MSKYKFFLLAALMLTTVASRAQLTWDASGTSPTAPTDGAGNWSTATPNWANGVIDSVWTNGDSAIFGSGGAGAVISVGAGTTVGNITLNTNYTFAGNPLTLVNFPTITVAGSATSASYATNGSVLLGTGFTKQGGGTLVLNPGADDTYSGLTTISNGTIQVSGNDSRLYIGGDLLVEPNGTYAYGVGASSPQPSGGIAASATVTINGGTVTNFIVNKYFFAKTVVLANGGTISALSSGSTPYCVTNTDARSGAILFPIHRIVNSNLRKSTPGLVRIGSRPNSSGTDGYVVTMNAGTLLFDYGYTANNANRIQTGAALTLGGGYLVFSNNVTSINPSTLNPSAAGTFINQGASRFFITNGGASGGSITFGALTRKTGGTFDFYKVSAGTSTTTSTTVNGIQGGWATWNQTDWLTGPNPLGPYSAYTTSADPTTWLPANNVSLSTSPLSAIVNGASINSLKLTAASTVTLNGTFTLTSGGLMVTGSGATAITGGTLEGASGTDLVVHQFGTANLNIGSTLADNGAATSLTKDGVGKLIITGLNNMTGTNYLNGGAVEVTNLAQLAAGPLDMNGGALRYTGLPATNSRTLTTRGLGPTFDVPSGTLTQSGTIIGSGDAIGDLGGLTKIGNGILVLTASNNFNGETVVSNGVLMVNGTNNCNGTNNSNGFVFDAGKVTVYGGTLGGNGFISGPVTVMSGGTISPGTLGTLTLATNLTLQSGSTSLFEATNSAPGDLIAVHGNLTIGTNCTVAINVLGSPLNITTNTLITYTGTLSGSFNPTVVLAGGSFNGSASIDSTSTPGVINLVLTPQVTITSQPQGTNTVTGTPFSVSVGATGQAPISYQWYLTDTNLVATNLLAGATNSTYAVAVSSAGDSGYYTVVVSNSFNSVTSSPALVIIGATAPSLSGPVNQTVIQGNNATFTTILTAGAPPPAYQWYKDNLNSPLSDDGVHIAGSATSSLTISNVTLAGDQDTYFVIATNIAGSATNMATLTVIVPPVITPQPTNLTVNVGNTAVFTSGATGVPTPGLQWYKNGAGIVGQTGNTLTIASAQGSDNGSYLLVATNSAGSVTSSIAILTVNSTTLATTAFAPANGATTVCYDTPLYVTFNGAISIVNSGKIRIYDSTNSVTPVDIIDMSSNTVVISPSILITNNIQPHSLFSGDSQVSDYFPVIISGTTAAIYPHSGVMTSNQTYYVTMDNGVVADSGGAYFPGISDTNAWRFTTKVAGPANPTNIVVAADGSGDFVTVQGAVDSVAPGNTNYTVVNVHNGNYVEIVNISGKNNLTFRGQTRTGTVIGYPNNNNLTGTTAGRMAFKVNSSDIQLENLTITNGTPQGGSQAEALLIYNNGLRCVVNDCDIISRQDTILINASTSEGYFYNCKVIGNFDYVWGVGIGYFTNCVFHTITNTLSGSYNLTAARTLTAGSSSTNTPWANPNGTTFSANGFSFVNCIIGADPGVTGITMADANGTAGGLVSWINCLIDTNAYVGPSTVLSNTYVFWQDNNLDITGAIPITLTNIQTIGVTNNDPRVIAATSSLIWFYGWTPQMAPNIVTQPVPQTVTAGQSTSFTVGAIGIPDPTYQWLQNGAPLFGATSATYNITSAVRTNGGNYSVVVSNSSGSVTSLVAVLTYSNTPPVAAPVSYTRNVAVYQLNINISNLLANVTDADGDAITLASVGTSTNGVTPVISGNDVVYYNTNAVADQFTYTVTDGFGGTNSALITINVSTQPLFGPNSPTISVSGGSANLLFGGIPGYSYSVLRSTNVLFSPFDILWTTNAPAGGAFQFTDPNPPQPNAFYRLLYNNPQ